MENDQEKSPVSVTSLAAEETLDKARNSEVLDFPHRIERYGRARKRALQMFYYLGAYQPPLPPLPPLLSPDKLPKQTESQLIKKSVARLKECGNWLHFRNYYTVDNIRLINAVFCMQHLICPLCAIRRGAKYLSAYLKKYQQIKTEYPDLKPCIITFTVKNHEDLVKVFSHLKDSLKTIIDTRRKYLSNSSRNRYTELSKVQGAVYTFELTNIGNGWHPHVHMIALCFEIPIEAQIRKEWKSITGDSYIVDVTPFRTPKNYIHDNMYTDIQGYEVEAFTEVFKYAVKFSDLSVQDNWYAYTKLKGQRLMGSFGLFRAVEVSEELTDELLEEELPYIDLLYRFVRGHYNLANIIHPTDETSDK